MPYRLFSPLCSRGLGEHVYPFVSIEAGTQENEGALASSSFAYHYFQAAPLLRLMDGLGQNGTGDSMVDGRLEAMKSAMILNPRTGS